MLTNIPSDMWTDVHPSNVTANIGTVDPEVYANVCRLLELARSKNERLIVENAHLTAELACSQDEIKRLEAQAKTSTPKIEPGLAMLGSINVLDIQNLDDEHKKKMDSELIQLRDMILHPAGHAGEHSKRDSVPARVESLFDRLDIRYDVKDGAWHQWGAIIDTSRPRKDRFLDLVLHRRYALERPDLNHEKGGYCTYRLIFWLNVVYRLLDMRELW